MHVPGLQRTQTLLIFVAAQAEADVNWYKPEVNWQTTVPDWARAYREIEEPKLSYLLWKSTPEALRWPHSASTHEWIIKTTNDDDERRRSEAALNVLRPPPARQIGKGGRTSVQPAHPKGGRGHGAYGGKGAKGKGGKGKQ